MWSLKMHKDVCIYQEHNGCEEIPSTHLLALRGPSEREENNRAKNGVNNATNLSRRVTVNQGIEAIMI